MSSSFDISFLGVLAIDGFAVFLIDDFLNYMRLLYFLVLLFTVLKTITFRLAMTLLLEYFFIQKSVLMIAYSRIKQWFEKAIQ